MMLPSFMWPMIVSAVILLPPLIFLTYVSYSVSKRLAVKTNVDWSMVRQHRKTSVYYAASAALWVTALAVMLAFMLLPLVPYVIVCVILCVLLAAGFALGMRWSANVGPSAR